MGAAVAMAEIVGGIRSGSVALIADAVHNLSVAASLAIARGARKVVRRPTGTGDCAKKPHRSQGGSRGVNAGATTGMPALTI